MEQININSWNDNKYEISTIQENIADDLFISCVSFEPRSIGIIKKLDTNYKAKTGIFITNGSFRKLDENKIKIDNILKKSHFFNDYMYPSAYIDNPIEIIMGIDTEVVTAGKMQMLFKVYSR